MSSKRSVPNARVRNTSGVDVAGGEYHLRPHCLAQMTIPPSTCRTAPVVNELASEAK